MTCINPLTKSLMLEFLIVGAAGAHFSTVNIYKPFWLQQWTTSSTIPNGMWLQLILMGSFLYFWFVMVLFGFMVTQML